MTAPNWFRIISDLIYVGIPMKELSRQVDAQMSEALIRHYRSGGQPTYVRGEALIRMWCNTLNKEPNDVPRQPWYPPNRIRHNRGLKA
jgi:hypothetical protein